MDKEESSAIWKLAALVRVSILSRISSPVRVGAADGTERRKNKNRRYIKSILWFVVVVVVGSHPWGVSGVVKRSSRALGEESLV
jgi:hypothetical protein